MDDPGLNSVDDFCVWGPPTVNPVGNAEREMVAYCSKSGHGSRVMPQGTLTGVHFVKTPKYVQITGQGDFTKINIPADDAGGELDNHGADGNGNPIGGLVYGNPIGPGQQFHEWTNFMSAHEFCIRACVGSDAATNCQHIYDTMGVRIPSSFFVVAVHAALRTPLMPFVCIVLPGISRPVLWGVD
jgi:hypothetical protein